MKSRAKIGMDRFANKENEWRNVLDFNIKTVIPYYANMKMNY
jgi:hypothetical protein